MIDRLVLLQMVGIPKVNLVRYGWKGLLVRQFRHIDVKNQIAFLIFIPFLCKEFGFSNVPFIPFKENRFNALFYNDDIFYILYNHLKHFFQSVKDENKLLKAVHSDLQIKSYLCGCRAFGLINKFVTGLLRGLLESGIHILDMNKHY